MTDDNQDYNLELRPKIIDKLPEIVIEDISLSAENLGSMALIDERETIALGDGFDSILVDLPDDGSKMIFVNGEIQIDRDALETEISNVNEWLYEGVRTGDNHVLEVYIRNLIGIGSEDEVAELRSRIETAFRTRDISHLLEQLTVEIVSAGIAERNIIREGLRPELSKQPIYFKDTKGSILSGEKDLDIVITRGNDKNGKFKLIVGSKQGISTVHLPEVVRADTFNADLENASKDHLRDVVSIPIKNATDGTESSVGLIEIHMGPVELLSVLAEQERKNAIAKKNSTKKSDDSNTIGSGSTSYSPPRPKPSPGRWISSSG